MMNDMNAIVSDLKLRLNIEHPGHEESYLFGYECAKKGLDESENPYAEYSIEAEQWSDGWWDGFYGEEPVFQWQDDAEAVNAELAANEHHFHLSDGFLANFMKITSVLAASAIVGYQVLDLVA